ncbi:hypothetical protein ABMY35_09755 [Pseudoalteromonas sp. BZB3]|uniref:hypothetical protein n=1 Tax=Pseudoalteromonas sp. BZB3 TaxID=3136670 RepID=UPI0032C424BD
MEASDRKLKFMLFCSAVALIFTVLNPIEEMFYLQLACFVIPLTLPKDWFEPSYEFDEPIKVKKEITLEYYDEVISIYGIIPEDSWIKLLKYLDEEEYNDFDYYDLMCLIDFEIIDNFQNAYEESTSDIDDLSEEGYLYTENLRKICGEHSLFNMRDIVYRLENESLERESLN